MSELIFHAEIQRSEKYPNAAFVFVPGDLKKLFGSLRPRVNIWYDAALYRGTVANMGEGPIAIIPKEVRTKLKKTHGDVVEVRITLDMAERKIDLPAELSEALNKHHLQKAYDSMSYSKRKEMARGITLAKKEDTRHKRLVAAIELLSKLKKK